MGKKRHSKDRMFITMTEHKEEWGGKKDPGKAPIAKLPFNSCSLSLLPFENPVCTKEGMVFDIVNVVPYLKKYKKNPVTGQPLKITDLIKLNFTKDEKGNYHDPVTGKMFTEYTVIVAIATSGNVYAKETVDELNKQPKNWKDLMTNEPFTVKDIIVLQDPADLKNRQVNDFDYIKNDIDVSTLREKNNDSSQFINQSSIGKKVLEDVKSKYADKEEFKEPEINKKIKGDSEKKVDSDLITPADFVRRKLESKKYVHERLTSGKVASSVTSTSVDIATDNSTRLKTAHEIRKLYHDIIKSRQIKGFVKLITNYGAMDLMIHCDFTPLTGENFIELCERKYYNETKFHRLVKNFVLQGGDPTGTGTGGDSIFGSPFDDEFHEKLLHDKPGVLSMANSGPRTNRSQFFFGLRPCKFLNEKHTVFGEVVNGHGILETINKIESDQNERPTKEIKIIDTIVLTNPYREVIKELMDKEKKAQEEENKKVESEKKKDERWITSKDTHLIIAPTKGPPKFTSSITESLFAPEESTKKNRKDFDFSGW